MTHIRLLAAALIITALVSCESDPGPITGIQAPCDGVIKEVSRKREMFLFECQPSSENPPFVFLYRHISPQYDIGEEGKWYKEGEIIARERPLVFQ